MKSLRPPRRVTAVVPLLATLLCGAGSRADDEPLRVMVQVRPGLFYVGQAIDLEVSVVAGREKPVLTMPTVEGADVSLVGTDFRNLSAGGIGDVVFEQNVFRSNFRLIARQVEPVRVPPISARLEDRKGASKRLTLQARPLPLVGRTADFLGGVGEFEVEASAEPISVRLGQTLDFRITVRGPGARGINQAPRLDRLERLLVGFDVERLPDQAVADPPTHTFHYRLRPTRSGEATLPPIAVASFDPRTGHYDTKVTEGIAIQVSDVPRFNPEVLGYSLPPVGRTTQSWTAREWLARAIPGLLALATAGLAVQRILQRIESPERGVRRVCDEVRSRLDQARENAARGRAITEGLIGYLSLTIRRPNGALTPFEAEDAVRRATGSDDLAQRASQLIAAADQAQYDRDLARSSHLEPDGRRFFQDLASWPTARSGKEGGRETR